MAVINGTPDNDTLPGTAQIASANSGAVFSRDAQGRWVVTSGQGADTLAGIEQVYLNGQTIRLGPGEVRVNTTSASSQQYASVAPLPDGGWLVSWMSDDQDGSGFGIYQQHFTSAGTPTGNETQVNTTSANAQKYPDVTALADGGWLVSWTSYHSGWRPQRRHPPVALQRSRNSRRQRQ